MALPLLPLGAGLEHGAAHRAETRRRAHLRVKEGYLGDGDVAARGEVGELRPALELPLGEVRVRVRVRAS